MSRTVKGQPGAGLQAFRCDSNVKCMRLSPTLKGAGASSTWTDQTCRAGKVENIFLLTLK